MFNKLTPEQQKVKSEFLIGKFYMAPEVMVEFAEYARAAIPNEIGGYCRVKQNGKNFIATELKVFPQTANGGFFQMDGREIAKWRMQMRKDGRAEESKEWNCLIHSHPVGTAPFLSGTDREQIIELGCRRHAWSIIMTSAHNIAACDWRVHFYHGGDTPFLAQDIPVDTFHPKWKEIKAAVKEAQGSRIDFVGAGAENGNRPGLNGTPIPTTSLTNSSVTTSSSLQNLEEAGVWLPPRTIPDPDEDWFGGITEGSIVQVNVDMTEIGEFDDTVRDTVIEMVGEQFSVEGVDDLKGMLIVNGIEFEPGDLELIQ